MPVNPFIAALGNILEGASSDRERTRKLKELEEEREYTRLERRQFAEDRAERRARERQAEADRLEALGYESETVLKSRLAGLGDAPAYEPGAASFDLGMDGVASKAAVGLSKPSPFTGSRLGVIGQSPFSGAKAQGMVEEADKAEQRKETQRRLASLVDVSGQGMMYRTTRAQQLAAEEQRLAGVTDRADVLAREKTRIEGQATELDAQQKRDRDIANLVAGGMTQNEAMAIIDAGARYGDLKETPSVSAANRRALALERRDEGRFLTKNVTDARANYTRLLASGLGSDADMDDARAAVAEAVELLNEWRAGGNKTPVVAEGGAGAGGGRRLPRPDDPDDRLTDEQVAFAQQNPGIAKPGLTARANAALIDAAMRKQATPVKLPTPVKPPTSAGEVVKRFMQGDSAVGSEEDVLPADTGAAVRRGVGESLGTYIDRTEGKTSGTEGKTPLTTSRTAGMTLPDSVGTLPGGSSSWDRIVPLGSGGGRSWADDPKLAAKLAAYLASLSEVELEALGMRPGETFENFKKRYPTIGPRSMLRFPRELDPGVVRPKR